MPPVLKPGLRRLWRDSTTLQLGIDPVRAVVLTGLTPAYVRALDALDPPGPDLDQNGRARDPATRVMIEILAQNGLLDDDGDAGGRPPPPRDGEQDRLAPDLAALSLASFGARLTRSAQGRRRRARVGVRGAGRVGAQIAGLLAAAGVGQVVVDDAAAATAADVAPGGLRLGDVGRPRALATGAVLTRVHGQSTDAPGSRVRGERSREGRPFHPDLLLLAPIGPPVIHPEECVRLEETGIPHLLAGVRETTGVVGPLVVPAVTGCLHCQHLHRDARDPAWPILALQMVHPSRRGPDPCEVSLATLVAAIATMQALDYLDHLEYLDLRDGAGLGDSDSDEHSDGGDRRDGIDQRDSGGGEPGAGRGRGNPLPTTAGGALEVDRSDLRIRRRTWPVHPQCPCRTARAAAIPPHRPASNTQPRVPAAVSLATGDPVG